LERVGHPDDGSGGSVVALELTQAHAARTGGRIGGLEVREGAGGALETNEGRAEGGATQHEGGHEGIAEGRAEGRATQHEGLD